MTHFVMVALRQNHQIEFPERPPPTVLDLEKQISMFVEHKTEAGGVDYYAPGDEKDNLTKAFMISIFAQRHILIKDVSIEHVGGGIRQTISPLNLDIPDYKYDEDILKQFSLK